MKVDDWKEQLTMTPIHVPPIEQLDEAEFNSNAAELLLAAEGIILQRCCTSGCVHRSDRMCGHPVHCPHFSLPDNVTLRCAAFDDGCQGDGGAVAATVRDIVLEYLEDSDFDGLFNDYGCGCQIDDLIPCGSTCEGCEPAYRFDCARCAKQGLCDKQIEDGDWVMSPSKDYCHPDYIVSGRGLQDVVTPSTLPAVASMTVGEMVYGIDWAKGPDMMACTNGAEPASPRDGDGIAGNQQEGLCQNPAKTDRVSRVLKEDRTAEYMRYLEYGV